MTGPNIVIVTLHDAGRHFGCYGVKEMDTPNIDAFAREGFLFSNYFSNSAVCSPSRAAMLMGRYPHSTGVMGLCHAVEFYHPNPGERHLSSVLREEGYETYLFGWQHETTHDRVWTDLGFDEIYLNDPLPPCDEVTACFVDHLRKRKETDKPFYAQIGFFEAHRNFDFGGVGPYDEKGVFIPPYIQDTPRSRKEFAELQGAIKKADDSFGVILETLKELNLEEDTLVVFSVDHGVEFPRAKATLYDPGIAVPLIMRWPGRGVSGGQTSDALTSHVDFFPTLLELLDIPIPSNVQGKSFAGCFDHPSAEIQDAIFLEFISSYRGIRTEKYKLIRHFAPESMAKELPINMDNGNWHSPTFPYDPKNWPYACLYDLEKDPNEFVNVYDDPDYLEVSRTLNARLKDWMEKTEDPLRDGPVATPFFTRCLDAFKND